MQLRFRSACALAALLTSSVAHAEDPSATPPAPPVRSLHWNPSTEAPSADAPTETTPRAFAEERPFVHLLDPSTPGAGQVGAEYAVGGATGASADRTLPTAVLAPGLVHSLSVAFGATDRVAPFVSGRVLADSSGEKPAWSGQAGVRWQLTRPGAAFRLTLVGAGFRDFGANPGALARIAASYDLGRLRLASNVHVEHVFATDRDKVDVILMAGASYRTTEYLRLGVEWVGQDVEETFDDGAEGGARHYAGPTVALDLMRGRLQLVGGPALGLTRQTSSVLGRAALLASF